MDRSYGSVDKTPNADKIASIVNRIHNNLQNIRQITYTLRELCNLLGGPKDTAGKRDEIQRQQKKANELLAITKSLFETSAMLKDVDIGSKLAIVKAKTAYQSVVEKYSEIQKKIMERMRHLAEEIRQSRPDHTHELGNSREQLQMQEELDEDDEELILAQETERRMAEMQKDLINIQDMFQEISDLVEEQAEAVDHIDGHVEDAYTDVVQGNQKLEQAVIYKKSAFKKKIIIALIIIVILAIIGLIIGLEVKKK